MSRINLSVQFEIDGSDVGLDAPALRTFIQGFLYKALALRRFPVEIDVQHEMHDLSGRAIKGSGQIGKVRVRLLGVNESKPVLAILKTAKPAPAPQDDPPKSA